MIALPSQTHLRLIRLVVGVVAQQHGLDADALMLPARSRDCRKARLRSNARRLARQRAIYVAHTAFSIRSPDVAFAFSISDSSARHAIRSVSMRREVRADEAAALGAIERALGLEVVE